MSYENVTFKTMSPDRKKTVRAKIAQMHRDGISTDKASQTLRISKTSVATAYGNLSRTRRTR